MSTILINDSTMTDIANAIREKSGTTNQMLPSEMAGKIGAIPTAEKRLIVTKIDCSKSGTTTFNGKGYVMLSNTKAANNTKIDGKAVIDIFHFPSDGQGGDYDDINPPYFKLKFEKSCAIPSTNYESSSRRSNNIAVLGEYSDEKLEGNPTEIYMAVDSFSNTTITGKGFAILSGNQYSGQQGRYIPANLIVDDNIVTTKDVLINETPIRVDFDKNIFIPTADDNPIVIVYVWN